MQPSFLLKFLFDPGEGSGPRPQILAIPSLATLQIACLVGVKRGRERGNLGARGRKEWNACKDATVFFIFHAQILGLKIVIGENFLNVNLRLNTFLVEINITPFE